MDNDSLTFETSLAGMKKSDWLAAVEELCDADGYFEQLGKRHYAAFIERSATLLVSFETLQGIPALSSLAQPLGWEMMLDHNWSSLCIASNGDTWFRDKAVYGYFDRLIDDGFFDDFDQVIFYGAGHCAYAAAAYSVASPEARVLAFETSYAAVRADLREVLERHRLPPVVREDRHFLCTPARFAAHALTMSLPHPDALRASRPSDERNAALSVCRA